MWCRVGVSIEMTDYQYETFVKTYKTNKSEAHNMLECLLQSDGAMLDGETYFPDLLDMGYDNIDMEFLF